MLEDRNETRRDDLELLSSSFKDQILSFLRNKIYYNTRPGYLNAIIDKLNNLKRGQRYCLLALNSSVVAQRILGSTGYDFRPYFRAFRERVGVGDYVVRIYCLSPSERGALASQLKGVRDVVVQNEMSKMVNLYKINPEHFNCVYILPLRDDAEEAKLSSLYKSLTEGSSTSPEIFLRNVIRSCDISNSILFVEHHDYEILHALGCGYKYQPETLSTEARERIDEYESIAASSKLISDDTLLPPAARGNHGIAILVALPIEFEAIKNHVDGRHLQLLEDGSVGAFFQGIVTNAAGYKLNIIVCKLPETGNIASTLATSVLIQRFSVHSIFHVGIAGGLQGEVLLGDVVVGQTIVYTEKKKVYKSKEVPDVRTLDCRFAELGAVHDAERYQARINSSPPIIGSRRPRAIFDCAILSGEKVIANPDLIKKIKTRVVRKIVAVENESSGIYFAANALDPRRTRYVTIKGISDYADVAKSDDWHCYAAAAAAAYAFEAIHLIALSGI